jgi:chromosome segregation ATPase
MAREKRAVMFKVRKSALRVQEQAIKKLQWILEQEQLVMVELERDLHEAKHSAKHWKEKYKELEDDYDKLKKRKKK